MEKSTREFYSILLRAREFPCGYRENFWLLLETTSCQSPTTSSAFFQARNFQPVERFQPVKVVEIVFTVSEGATAIKMLKTA